MFSHAPRTGVCLVQSSLPRLLALAAHASATTPSGPWAANQLPFWSGSAGPLRAAWPCFLPRQVKHLLDSWDDYFAFSFSRNVLRRAISQYQVKRGWWDGDVNLQRGSRGHCRLHAVPKYDCKWLRYQRGKHHVQRFVAGLLSSHAGPSCLAACILLLKKIVNLRPVAAPHPVDPQ